MFFLFFIMVHMTNCSEGNFLKNYDSPTSEKLMKYSKPTTDSKSIRPDWSVFYEKENSLQQNKPHKDVGKP